MIFSGLYNRRTILGQSAVPVQGVAGSPSARQDALDDAVDSPRIVLSEERGWLAVEQPHEWQDGTCKPAPGWEATEAAPQNDDPNELLRGWQRSGRGL